MYTISVAKVFIYIFKMSFSFYYVIFQETMCSVFLLTCADCVFEQAGCDRVCLVLFMSRFISLMLICAVQLFCHVLAVPATL